MNFYNEIQIATNQDDFTATIFNILYQTNNLPNAINNVMELVGTTYKLNHIYISDSLSLSKILYKWNNDTSNMGNNFNDFEILNDYFNDDGFYYCNDKSIFKNSSGSVLFCKINSNPKEYLYIIYEKDINNSWTKEELDQLNVYARMITTFILSDNNKQIIFENTLIDPLTKLPNAIKIRFWGNNLFEQNIASEYSVIYMNVTNFKLFNIKYDFLLVIKFLFK